MTSSVKLIRLFHRYIALILLTLFPVLGYASPCKPQFEEAFWAEKDMRIVGLDAAYSACPNRSSGVRVGASYFADERFEFKGVTGSLRLQV